MPLKLAGLVMTSGRVPPTIVDDALARYVLSGGSLDTVFLELGVISEPELLRFLESASGLKGATPALLASVDEQLASDLPLRIAERYCLVPVRVEGSDLLVAGAYPVNQEMLEEISFMLGRELLPLVGVEARLREAISRIYRRPLAPRYAAVLAALSPPAAPTATPPDKARPSPPPAATAKAPPPSPKPTRPPRSAKPAPAPIDAPPAAGKRPAAPPESGEEDGLESALARVIETAEPEAWSVTEPALKANREPEEEPLPAAPEGKRRPKRNAPSPTDDVAATWSLPQARAALEAAADRDAIVEVALRFARKTFDYAAAFAVVGGNAVSWAALGEGADNAPFAERVSIPLDAPSVLRTVIMARGRYLGPIPSDALSQGLVADLGRAPKVAFFCPVEVRDRPVALLYGDVVGRAASAKKVAEFVQFAQFLGKRLERLILEQKRQLAASRPSGPLPDALRPPAMKEVQPADDLRPLFNATTGPSRPLAPEPNGRGLDFDVDVELEVDMSAPSAGTPSSTLELFQRSPARRSAGSLSFTSGPDEPAHAIGGLSPSPGASRVPSQAGRVEPEQFALPPMGVLFGAADRLLGTDVADRARALAELSRYPEIAAAVLVARFPGPLLRARLPVIEIPSPEELGPIPAALVRMGLPAALALLPLLDHRDVDTRYFALLTAGKLPFPVLLGPVAQKVFDRNAMVANAARVALAGMKHLPGFEDALVRLRQGLSADNPEVAALAARALGVLHDLANLDQLMALSGHDDRSLAQAAADALREITKQSLGTSPKKWQQWWEENGKRSRMEWLIVALRHRDLDLRLSAIDELVRVVHDNFGYYADGPRKDRDEAVARWDEWWKAQKPSMW